jgi:aryl-alcohol dehydrogenase-like predicted oxidoreductase
MTQFRYRTLGNSGLRVSEAALGTMTFGEDWGWGASGDEARGIFERYVDAGGNFVDTANNYTNGTAERMLGDLLDGRRDRFVVATKYTLSTDDEDPNAAGNGRKNMYRSVERSLDRLDTDYLDLLWVHAPDGVTPIEEVLRGLDDLVSAGTVHHVGLSDFPAWLAARAITVADERGYAPVSALQFEYNLLERTVERELLPLARATDRSVVAWGPLKGGVLTGKYSADGSRDGSESADDGEDGEDGEDEGRVRQTGRELAERDHEVARAVRTVAADLDATPAQVALAWLRGRPGDVIPILGARTVEQIEEAIGAFDASLPPAARERLDAVSEVSMGFPTEFLSNPTIRRVVGGGTVDRLDASRY